MTAIPPSELDPEGNLPGTIYHAMPVAHYEEMMAQRDRLAAGFDTMRAERDAWRHYAEYVDRALRSIATGVDARDGGSIGRDLLAVLDQVRPTPRIDASLGSTAPNQGSEPEVRSETP